MSTSALTFDLLAWIDSRTRSYEETIEAWKTSCPRLSIWDDAVVDGLVRIDRRSGEGAIVVLTALGQTALAADDLRQDHGASRTRAIFVARTRTHAREIDPARSIERLI
jgi:hypothetical protein